MPSAQMNVILRDIRWHQRIFDLDQRGLGRSLCRISAVAIGTYIDSQRDWDGTAWAPLSVRYEAWKIRHYPGRPMAVLDRIMRTHVQLVGTLTIAQYQVAQLYGTTLDAQLHSVWFQEGRTGSNYQPPRTFYALNPLAITELNAFLDAWFARYGP